MALNFGEEKNTSSDNNRSASGKKPKTKVWLNIGIQKGDNFINLPYGLALDTMDQAKVSGQPDWQKLQQARNAFLKMLVTAGLDLPAGGEEEVHGLVIKLKHSTEIEEIADSENDLVDFGGISFGSPSKPKGKGGKSEE